MSGIPFRPSMSIPREEHMHRSMPTSPYDLGPRDPSGMSATFESRLRMEDPDYFSTTGIGPFGRRCNRGIFPPGFEPETAMGSYQQYIDETVRRTNLTVQYVNSQIRPAARHCQIQPKMCLDAKFPPDFRVAKTAEELRAMDGASIYRILRAYGLPTDLRSLRPTSQDTFNLRMAHQAKLCALFDFLGAVQIAERQRMKRANGLPY